MKTSPSPTSSRGTTGYNWRGYRISGLYAGICVVDNDPFSAIFESSCDDER